MSRHDPTPQAGSPQPPADLDLSGEALQDDQAPALVQREIVELVDRPPAAADVLQAGAADRGDDDAVDAPDDADEPPDA